MVRGCATAAVGIEVDDFLFPFLGRLEGHLAEEGRHAQVVVRGSSSPWDGRGSGRSPCRAPMKTSAVVSAIVCGSLIGNRPGRNWPGRCGNCCRWRSAARGRTGRRACSGRCCRGPSDNRSAPPSARRCTGYSLLIRSRSPHFKAQNRRTRPRSSRRSISLLRFCGSPSEQEGARTSSGVGRRPSRPDRRGGEHLVRARRRRRNAQLLQLGEHQLVDLVVRLDVGKRQRKAAAERRSGSAPPAASS